MDESLPPLFTVGHSIRPVSEFVELLRLGEVGMVVDVRRFPRSRTNPSYNFDVLPGELARWQIAYERIAELGGLRKRCATVPPEINGFWENRSFHHYADYALSPAFGVGLAKLLDLSADRRCAIMCAEAVWWRCHRRIIADYLLVRGRQVFHLLAPSRIEPAKLTPAAVPRGESLVYPATLPDG